MATDSELQDFRLLALEAKVLDIPDEDQAVRNAKFFREAIGIVPGLVDGVLSYRSYARQKLRLDNEEK